MARAARDARRQAWRAGLLTAALAACAVIEEPPGGPPDFAPPALVSITPDSGAVVPELDAPLRIQFSEVISEQSGGGLDRLVRLSPRTDELEVAWKRSAIELRPKAGWHPGVIYQLVLLPGVADLRNNRTEEGRTVVFSTGGPIPDTRLSGTVVDWENGRIGQRALVEAWLLPDSLVYVTSADSTGKFTLTSVPAGEYWVTATADANNNGRREPREPFDSVSTILDSTATHVFWAFARDTVGPQIRELTFIDSVTMRVTFTQKLQPGEPDSAAITVFALPDTLPVVVRFAWSEERYDSATAAERQAAADSAKAAAASARAEGDTTGVVVPSAEPPAPPERAAQARAARPPPTVGADTTAADSLPVPSILDERPVLSATWYVRILQPMDADARYLVRAITRNLSGAVAESGRVLVTPTPAPPDST
jgi:hypothetical protein